MLLQKTLVIILTLLILSIAPVSALEYSAIQNNTTNSTDTIFKTNRDLFQQIDYTTLLLYKMYGIRVNVIRIHTLEELKNILNYKVGVINRNAANPYAYDTIILRNISNMLSFEVLVDGDSEYGFYAVKDVNGKITTCNNLREINSTSVILQIETFKDHNPDFILQKLTHLLNNPLNEDDEDVDGGLMSFCRWLTLHLQQYARMTPEKLDYARLESGMVAICKKRNDTLYPCLIKEKNDTNISILESNSTNLYILEKTVFLNDFYTGLALRNINADDYINATTETNNILSFKDGILDQFLSYAKYLLKKFFNYTNTDTNYQTNPFLNVLWVSLDLFKNYHIHSSVKEISLKEVKEEYTGHYGTLLLIKDDEGRLLYARVVQAYENNFKLQVGNQTEIMDDEKLDKYYTGITLFIETDSDLNWVLAASNTILLNIDPVDPSKPRSHWFENTLHHLYGYLMNKPGEIISFLIVGVLLSLIPGIITALQITAISAMIAAGVGICLGMTVAALAVAAVIGLVVWGVSSWHHAIKKKNSWKKFKKKYLR